MAATALNVRNHADAVAHLDARHAALRVELADLLQMAESALESAERTGNASVLREIIGDAREVQAEIARIEAAWTR